MERKSIEILCVKITAFGENIDYRLYCVISLPSSVSSQGRFFYHSRVSVRECLGEGHPLRGGNVVELHAVAGDSAADDDEGVVAEGNHAVLIKVIWTSAKSHCISCAPNLAKKESSRNLLLIVIL